MKRSPSVQNAKMAVQEELEASLAAARRKISELQYELDIYHTERCMLPEDVLNAAEVEIRCRHLETHVEEQHVAAIAIKERCEYFEGRFNDSTRQIQTLSLRLEAADEAAKSSIVAEELKQHVAEVNKEKMKISEQSDKYHRAAERLHRDLEHAKKVNLNLQEDVAATASAERTAMEEAEAARRTWREGHSILEDLKCESQLLRGRNGDLESEVERLRLLLGEKEATETTLNTAFQSLKKENMTLRDEVKELKESVMLIETLKRETSVLKEELQDARLSSGRLTADVEERQSRIRTLETQNSKLHGELSTHIEERAKTHSEMKVLESTLGQQIRQLKHQNGDLRGENSSLQTQLGAAEKKILTLSLISTHKSALNETAASIVSQSDRKK